MIKVNPVRKRVLLKRIKQDRKIDVLQSSLRYRNNEFEVVSVGSLVRGVKAGDKVIVDKFKEKEIEIDERKFYLANFDDIAGVFIG